jgi:hypothetical protein
VGSSEIALGAVTAIGAPNGDGSVGPIFMGLLLVFAGVTTIWYVLQLRPLGRATLVLDSEGLSHSLSGDIRWLDVSRLSLERRDDRNREIWVLLVFPNAPGVIRRRNWLFSDSQAFLEVTLTGLDVPYDVLFRAAQDLQDWRARGGVWP